MQPLTSWAIFLAIAGALAWKYGLLDRVLGRKHESGPNRGRTRSRAADTKVSDWVLEAEKETKSTAKAMKKQAPRKSVKKTVQEVGSKVEAALSGVTSATAADADETSNQSPSLVSKIADKVPSGKDVSDMLDAKNLPNVLKINASEKVQHPAKPQQKKSEPETQTKKQAQNAKKRAAEKEIAARAEAERKKLEEEQRRRAREARGEAPKNGVRSAQAPTSNAWNKVAAPAANEPVNGQLLDTIDATSTASSATNGTAPTPDSTSYDNLPSEEDQIAAALADSAWTTVPKGKKKKTKTNGEAVGEGSDSGAPNEAAPATVKATPAPAPKKENKKESMKPTSRFEVLSEPISSFNDPRDSDWPVV